MKISDKLVVLVFSAAIITILCDSTLGSYTIITTTAFGITMFLFGLFIAIFLSELGDDP